MKYFQSFALFILIQYPVFSQTSNANCLHQSLIERQSELNPNFEHELEETEKELQKIIRNFDSEEFAAQKNSSTYVIPVVMHVFHWGDDGKMDMEQALSGLELLNQDFNGLNDDWDNIDPEFDEIKGALDITFCLAQIDPEGNPTTGIVYHEDQEAMLNNGDLFQHAWDNYKYLNIYFPKYTGGAPSNFTAYAYYPSTSGSDNNSGGVFYSSIRWGYGNYSELEEGDDWASVCSHELGHWLNLRHTFQGGCDGSGDLVEDTPPCLGGTIELSGCNNNDFTCGVHTNGSNFMDYNHRCKKMFTEGQIQRMEAALYLPSRISLWSLGNLIDTGCEGFFSSTTQNDISSKISIYPNPVKDFINIEVEESIYDLKIINTNGQVVYDARINSSHETLNVSQFTTGIYLFSITTESGSVSREVSIH